MKILSIILAIAFSVSLSVIEIPKMVKDRLYKELWLFLVLLLTGVISGILLSSDRKISNPSDWVKTVYSPFLGFIKSILK